VEAISTQPSVGGGEVEPSPALEGQDRALGSALPRVRLGVDVLLDSRGEALRGRRVGLVTHAAGVDGALVPTVDRLARDRRFELVQLWGPEHGIRGEIPAGDQVADELDPATGIPVESLYGARKAPSEATLARVDLVLVDLQDIGARTYTYVSTLGEVLQACARHEKPVWVLDRPNPLGGMSFEGPLVEPAYKSFIGWGPLPLTHGLTIGEVARLYVRELPLAVELEVVPLEHWSRERLWEDTGLTWTTTSPHIPRPLAAHLYAMTGMIAATTANVSDGVGSPAPFELVGGSFVDSRALAAELSSAGLEGLRFQACSWKPFYGKFQGQVLSGVRLVLDDPRRFRPVLSALAALCALRDLHPQALQWTDAATSAKHWGNARVLERLLAGDSAEAIEASWQAEREAFAAVRERALLYR
jgi:uncharacterized protein YbbC (DUF1343 family)